MAEIDARLIDQLMRLGRALPEPERQQLFELVSSWRPTHRHAPRESFSDTVAFKTESGIHYGRAKDVSATGLFLLTKERFKVGEPVQLMLTMITAPNPFRLSGTIRRCTPDGIAIQFDIKQESLLRQLGTVIARHAAMSRS